MYVLRTIVSSILAIGLTGVAASGTALTPVGAEAKLTQPASAILGTAAAVGDESSDSAAAKWQIQTDAEPDDPSTESDDVAPGEPERDQTGQVEEPEADSAEVPESTDRSENEAEPPAGSQGDDPSAIADSPPGDSDSQPPADNTSSGDDAPSGNGTEQAPGDRPETESNSPETNDAPTDDSGDPSRDNTESTPGESAATVAAELVGKALAEESILSPDVEAILEKDFPEGPDDLRAIEQQVQRVLERVMPATLGVRIGSSSGSAVIISPDGLVLSCGHVAGDQGRRVTFTFPDGSRARGRTLGVHHTADAALMQLTGDGPWPYVPMAAGGDLSLGEWVIAAGQPGGVSEGRSPPVRLGRVLYVDDDLVATDCTLVGGDSGGPLFNMRGEVVGIHSRIGERITSNFHVPVSIYHNDWDRLVAAEVWGRELGGGGDSGGRPLLGLAGHTRDGKCLVTQVFPNTPAERADIRVGDVVLRFDGEKVSSYEDFGQRLLAKSPLEFVNLDVEREGEVVTMRIRLGGITQPLPGSPELPSRGDS